MLIHLEEQKFEDVVASKLCLVDFYATWCGPCRMLAQEFEEIVETTQDFDIVKVDIDEFPALAHQFAIEVVPTMIVFKGLLFIMWLFYTSTVIFTSLLSFVI